MENTTENQSAEILKPIENSQDDPPIQPFQLPIDLKGRKIGILYPSPDYVHTGFIDSLIQMITQTSQFVPLGLSNSVSSRIAVNRNTLVENARLLGATDLLYIDADSKFPVNALMRLLMHNRDIVGATTCRRKGNDRTPVAAPLEDIKSLQPNQRMVKMKQIGLPFMLIKMSVFDKLDASGMCPDKCYFAEPPRWMMNKIGWNVAGTDALVGEDEYFCELALRAGFDIWGDMELSMELGHIGSHVFYIENSVVPEARIDEKL